MRIKDPDILFIVIACLFVLTAILMKDRVVTDIRIYEQTIALSDELAATLYSPMTKEDMIALIDELDRQQEQLSKTTFLKHFISLDEVIEEMKGYLGDRDTMENSDEIVTLLTPREIHITASTEISKPQLRKLGDLIDQLHLENESVPAYSLEIDEDHEWMLVAIYDRDPTIHPHVLQRFVDEISRNIFDSEPVNLYLVSAESNDEPVAVFSSE